VKQLKILLLVLSVTISKAAAEDFSLTPTLLSLDDYQKMYNYDVNKEKDAIRGLRKLKKKYPRNLEVRKTLTNYYLWEEYTNNSKNEASEGYDLTKETESGYPYFFYDKKTSNRLFLEGSLTSGYRYDSKTFFLESSHNYDKNDWFLFNYSYQRRESNPAEEGDLIGAGLITFLSKDSNLQTMVYLSPKDSFLPTYIIENEIYQYVGNNQFSLNIKYSAYLNYSSLITFAPHMRHDFDSFYLGARAFLTFTEKKVLPSYRFYWGKSWTYRFSTEVGYSVGSTKEDGKTTVDFRQFDLSFKYRWSHDTDIGFRYNFYDSTSLANDHSYFFNIMWKY